MKPDRNRYIGKVLQGGYRVQKFIGAGAFAYVYYAQGPNGAGVAVKVQYAAADEARKRFVREIKVLRQLPPSPYCISYVDDGTTDDGLPFLVMEYVDGTTLKEALKFKPVWGVEEACQFMIQLCEAFAGLHDLGLAHRDVKPENIMLTRDWRVKLMDLGLVKDAQGLLKLFESEDILKGRDFAENLDKGVLAGTPEYMAPEQFSDPSLEDERLAQTDTTTDVYSLGIIFLEMLTGQKLFPFKPNAKNQQDYARALLTYLKKRTGQKDQDLQSPPSVPPNLWSVIARSLRKDPKLRQRTAVEMGADIRRFAETGQGVVLEDEDKTSAIDLNSFLALHGDPSGGAASGGGASGGRKTMPLEPISSGEPPQHNQPPPGYQPSHNPNQPMRMQAQPGYGQQQRYGSNPNLPPGYDPAPHMQTTNPHMGGFNNGYPGPYPQQQSSNSAIILWTVLISLIVVGVGVVVALLVL